MADNIAPTEFVCTAREPSADVLLPGFELTADQNKYWGPAGVVLTVNFLDNPPVDLRSKILLHMNAWGRWANVRFVYSPTDAKVRIDRDVNDKDGLYWSYVGKSILSVAANHKTMNLGGFTSQTSDSKFYRHVRHETGHTLGFPHEHLRKEIVDRIDREKAIAYYKAPPNNWDEAKTIANVLTPLDYSALISTAQPDPLSIMCYSLPASIMKDGVAIAGGADIDSQDARFAASLYPKARPDPAWLVPALMSVD